MHIGKIENEMILRDTCLQYKGIYNKFNIKHKLIIFTYRNISSNIILYILYSFLFLLN